MGYTLEICVDSLASALIAFQNGANRLELCDNLDQGGITPSAGKIKLVKKYVEIPVFVLIRPRKGDFLYSDLEFELMLEDINSCKELGADGIVAGVLDPDGNIDTGRSSKLKAESHPLPFTFHRAFDMVRHAPQALEELIAIGADRVLTSGQKANVELGLDNLRHLVGQSEGRIEIMAGGGLTGHRLKQLLSIEGLNEFHASARHKMVSLMKFKGQVSMGVEAVEEEFSWAQTDPEKVASLSAILCDSSFSH